MKLYCYGGKERLWREKRTVRREISRFGQETGVVWRERVEFRREFVPS